VLALTVAVEPILLASNLVEDYKEDKWSPENYLKDIISALTLSFSIALVMAF
jgi:hypothetical protein